MIVDFCGKNKRSSIKVGFASEDMEAYQLGNGNPAQPKLLFKVGHSRNKISDFVNFAPQLPDFTL